MAEHQPGDGPAGGASKVVEIDVGSWYRVRDARAASRRFWFAALIVLLLIVLVSLIGAITQDGKSFWSIDAWRFLTHAETWFGILAFLLFVRILVSIVNWIMRSWYRVARDRGEYKPELRETVVAAFDQPVSEVWSRVQSFKRSLGGSEASASLLRKVLLLATAALFVGAAGTFLFSIFYPLAFDPNPSPAVDRIYSIVFNVSLYAILLSPLLATLARRLTMPSSQAVREQDQRRPVLFLRSFVDDDLTVARPVRVVNGVQAIDLRFEEAIAGEFSQYGPFLAIGRPGERLPRTGAAREYVGDEWQRRVSELADEALVVVVSLGRSEGMEWELRHLLTRGQIGKVIVLIPPRGHDPVRNVTVPVETDWRQADSHAPRGISGIDIFEWNDRKERWRKLVAHFDGTAWAAGLQQVDIAKALAVSFVPDGKVIVIRSDRADERDYCFAITAAIYRMNCAAPPPGGQTQQA